MKYWLVVIASLACTSALVSFQQLEKGENGCKSKGVEIPVAGVHPIDDVCGVLHCQNTNGDALVLYCQIPPFFVYCEHDAVVTTMPFPECCWKCARYVECDKNGKPLEPYE